MSTLTKKGRVGSATLPKNLLAVADGVHGEPFLNPTAASSQAASAATSRHAPSRPVYLISLEALPRTDGRQALRGLLKVALRKFRLRCVSLKVLRR